MLTARLGHLELEVFVGMTFVVSVVVRLEFFSWFEADRLARRDCNFFACSWIPSDTTLPGFYDKHAKAA